MQQQKEQEAVVLRGMQVGEKCMQNLCSSHKKTRLLLVKFMVVMQSSMTACGA